VKAQIRGEGGGLAWVESGSTELISLTVKELSIQEDQQQRF